MKELIKYISQALVDYPDKVEVTEIIDVTPLPHNGCRPPKRPRN